MKNIPDFLRLSFMCFSAELLDKDICTSWVLKLLHPEGAFCPRCGSPISSEKNLQNFWSVKKVFCKDCRRMFTALTGTILNGIHMDLRAFFLLSLFLYLGVDRRLVAGLLKIHPETVRLWENKLTITSLEDTLKPPNDKESAGIIDEVNESSKRVDVLF